MSRGADISVIIPAYNASATIGNCLRALADQSIPDELCEIIVVDDGSTDETGPVAAALGARVLRKARGRPAAARNLGLQAARGAIICFTDADCEPLPDWLAAITAPLRHNPAIIGAKGVYRTRQRSVVARFVQLEYEEKYEKLRGRERIDFIDTYSAAYRRDVLLANDGFDERFPVSEDRELAYRLAARGYEMVFCPGAVVFHLHSATLVDYARKKTRIGYWVAQTLLRYPAQGISDSYTPQSMKVQVGLMALSLLTLPLALLEPWLALVPLAFLLALWLTTASFVRLAWSKDRLVAVSAPPLLTVRALALGLGYAWGLAAPQADVEAGTTAIGGARYVVKRGLDITAGLLGTALLAVLFVPLALYLRLSGVAQPLRADACAGQRGATFQRWRLCLPPGRGGLLLRRLRLDRLPAIWNVLRGEMSLVGPEAVSPAALAYYADWHRRRLSIKPGLTGPVQIMRGPRPSLDERAARELEYIETYSLRRDLKLLWQTLTPIGRPRAQ